MGGGEAVSKSYKKSDWRANPPTHISRPLHPGKPISGRGFMWGRVSVLFDKRRGLCMHRIVLTLLMLLTGCRGLLRLVRVIKGRRADRPVTWRHWAGNTLAPDVHLIEHLDPWPPSASRCI